MHKVKCDAYIRMHTVSRQEMSVLSHVHVYSHSRICSHPAHSHTHMDTDALTHTQLYIH